MGDLRKTIACGKIEMKMDVKMACQEGPGGAWREAQVIFLPPGLETTGCINPRPALKGTETRSTPVTVADGIPASIHDPH